MTEWGNTTKMEVVAYISKITTPRTAKNLLRLCMDRIEVLERANASFGNSMEKFAENLPGMLEAEMDRRSNAPVLQAHVPDELEAPSRELPNPHTPPADSIKHPQDEKR